MIPLFLLLLFLFFIFSKLTIIVNYQHHNDDDDLRIVFSIWFGLIKYKINVPLIKIDENSPSIVVKSHSHMGAKTTENPEHNVKQITKKDVMTKFRNAKVLLEKVIHLHVIVRKFLRKVSIKKLEWHTFIGLGDAAYTGMAAGGLWTIKGGIIGLLSHYLNLQAMPQLSITPHFQAAVIQTRLTCIFRFRIGHAILAGLKLIKFWKGGKPNFENKTNFSTEKTKSI